MNVTEDFITEHYIVAIGGSAGSLESLTAFFAHTPIDSASYIIIRHMPKDFQSQLKSILSCYSKLPILEVSDGMRVEPNTVYIGTSQKHVVIRDNQFHLIDRPLGPNRAVDLFLRSLAHEQLNNKAIAIILSGIGFDGVNGACAIKEAGGLVIAQDPTTCQYDMMPRYTIESEVTDQVLAPSAMPAAIQAYVQSNKTK